MKPLHIGLLAVGATLAGGLAFEMTQLPAIPVAVTPGPQPAADMAPAVSRNSDSAVPLKAPGAIVVRQAKPSPIPKPAPPQVAEAPAPVYAPEAKPAPRQARPVLLAKASLPKAAPTQWAPLPYQTPTTPKAVLPPQTVTAESAAPPTPTPAAEPRHVTLQTGMTVAVRLEESLSAERAAVGDMFEAVLAEPLVVDNLVIAERGARASGRVVEAQKGGRLGNPSVIELALTSVDTSDGQHLALNSDPWVKQAERADDPIGAIFGRPKPANVPAASVIRFRLSSRVTVTEQLASR